MAIDKQLAILYTSYTMNVISATNARNRFFELVNLAMYKGDEFLVEKDGRPAIKLIPARLESSVEETRKILADIRRVFAKSAKRRYWSVVETPTWKRKQKDYLNNLSKGIFD